MIKKLLSLAVLLSSLTACQAAKTLQQAYHQPQQQLAVGDEQQRHKATVALVLGSGGVRGYAHIGVLQVLEQQGIKPDFIVGTSAGSLAGVLYSGKQSAQSLYEIADQLKVNDIREFDIGWQSIFDGVKIANFVNKHIDQQKLEELKTPVYVVATRLDNGEQIIFNQGDAGQAVQASITIPSMFAPVKIGQFEYVDGGLVSPVPVKVARDLGADIIIAVNILAKPHYTKTDNMWGLFNQNINIMQYKMANEELKYADIIIEPDIREKGHLFDMKTRDGLINAGKIATQQHLEIIVNQIEKINREKERK